MAMIFKVVVTSAFVIGLNLVVCLENNIQLNREADDGNTKMSLAAVSQVMDLDVEPQEDFKRNKKLFQASKEWKVVEPDEMLPPGLQVRLNLQTGLREAKQPSEDDTSNKNYERDERVRSAMQAAIEETLAMSEGTISDDKNEAKPIKGDKISQTKLKEILKKLKDEEIKETTGERNFKSMEELKREFKDLNIDVKLDSEILRELLARYNRTDLSRPEKLDVLADLEYYLHQIDNANMFVDVGGLTLLLRDLNETEDDLQSSTLLVVMAAVQSNPHGQVAAVREGLLEMTLKVARTSTSNVVRGRAVGALSSLLRNFPFAQKKFGDLGGFEFLVAGLVAKGGVDDRTAVKVISMVTDLLEEQISTEKDEYVNVDTKKEKLKQYERVRLVERLTKTEWCIRLPNFLSVDDLTMVEKVLNSMLLWLDRCRSQFSESRNPLRELEIRLRHLRHQDEYLQQHEFIDELLTLARKIFGKTEIRSEL